MSRTGTRRSSILKRRSAQKDRLIKFLKKGGILAAAAALVLWAGSWLFVSGTVSRAGHEMRQGLLSMSADAGFAVRNILVEGRIYTDPDTILAIANVERGDPVFAFDPEQAQGMIEKLSWVRAVHVERRLPDTIYVALEERRPLVLWQRQKKLSLIDEEGVVLTNRKLGRFKDLIIVIGDKAPERAPSLLEMLEAEPVVEERVEAATFVSGRRWDLTLKTGAAVKLPEEELGLALRRLASLHEQDGLLDKKVQAIDVREPERIAVRTRPGAVQEYRANYIGGNGI